MSDYSVKALAKAAYNDITAPYNLADTAASHGVADFIVTTVNKVSGDTAPASSGNYAYVISLSGGSKVGELLTSGANNINFVLVPTGTSYIVLQTETTGTVFMTPEDVALSDPMTLTATLNDGFNDIKTAVWEIIPSFA